MHTAQDNLLYTVMRLNLGGNKLGEASGEGELRVLAVNVLLEAEALACAENPSNSSQRLLRGALESLLADVALDSESGLGTSAGVQQRSCPSLLLTAFEASCELGPFLAFFAFISRL